MNGQIAAHGRDAPWQFIQLGRHLERADLTRILDAGAVALLQSAGARR
ncbi:MAG: alpha-E domain-containing protein [Gammaproteobacteria bacterium]|nr:alpha-E domain-containing protein [Gammaproteobacteria bacterium]